MKSRCCRSLPRCAGCPVVLKRAGGDHRHAGSLLDDILQPRRTQAYPQSVLAALADLDRARASRTPQIRPPIV